MSKYPEKDSLIYRLYRTRLISELTHSQFWFLKKELKICRSVLDIGCGADSPLRYCKIPYSIGVDAYKPAIREARTRGTHNGYIIAEINNLELKPNSFDAVVLIEVLEHLDKDKGKRLLEKIEQWAKKKVLISCPNGYLPQGPQRGNPYQVHRSGWDIEEMTSRGYKAYGMVGLRWKPSRFLFFPLALWAVISVMLQNLTYRFPKMAFEVFYVKEKKAK
ncbi:MAG: class I SAM-dependent methyltransferase [Candidatus Omnitrophica bacterium]|nr:class I SAM-dependent methyltransferase [Candidatus Omnitrophota bacterium]